MMLAESSAREPLEPQLSAVVSFHEDGARSTSSSASLVRASSTRRRRRARSVSPDAPP